MQRITACRLPDWEARLHAWVEAAAERSHVYGEHDCLAGLSAGVVEAVTGVDCGSAHCGKYRTALGAARYLKRLGYDTPEAFIDAQLDEKPVGFAQRGDLVLVPGNGLIPDAPSQWAIPALCYGSTALVIGQFGEREGLFPMPRSTWLKAYAVGDHHSGSCKD